MITDDELMKKIDDATRTYNGQIDHLYEAIGMVTVGRLMGWRVMRLVASRRCWTLANDIFGDLKEVLPEVSTYTDRSLGLKIYKKFGDYWEIVKGHSSMPMNDRRKLEHT